MDRRQLVDIGLLVLRVGLGAMMIGHGWGKLTGGPEVWVKLGGAMSTFGITFAPTFWGFCAAAAEVFGGLALIVGLGTRVAAASLAFTMFVAWAMHFSKGDPFTSWSHSAEDGIAFLALILTGAGKYSLDSRLFPPNTPSAD